jgi:hypothetical protein
MAHYQLLCINSSIVKIDNELVYVSYTKEDGIHYITNKTKRNVDYFVSEKIDTEIENDMYSDYTYLHVRDPYDLSRKDCDEMYNRSLNIKSIRTPGYIIRCELAKQKEFSGNITSNYITNQDTAEHITNSWWKQDRLKFISEEILKFADLIPYVGMRVSNNLRWANNTALRLKYNGNTIFNIFNFETDALFSPFSAFTLTGVKLFNSFDIYNTKPVLDEPVSFRTSVYQDSVILSMATCYDILRMLNIESSLKMNASTLVRLLGAVVLNTAFPASNLNVSPYLPTDGMIWYTAEEEHGEVQVYTEDPGTDCRTLSLMEYFLIGIAGKEYRKFLAQFSNPVLMGV